eukprot:3601924-Alexandrium_andersonii.AAC.1
MPPTRHEQPHRSRGVWGAVTACINFLGQRGGGLQDSYRASLLGEHERALRTTPNHHRTRPSGV